MDDSVRIEKNKQIGKTRKLTKDKRVNQSCQVFKIKIQDDRLSKKQRECLEMQFIEAKRIYNHVLSWSNEAEENKPWNFKLGKEITYLDKEKNKISYELRYLGSQQKQSICQAVISNIRALAAKKLKSGGVGRLKFKKSFNSIDLKQYNATYRIKGKKIGIQGVPGLMKVNGLEQIPVNFEFANAKLLNTPKGYYVAITTYSNEKKIKKFKEEEIGIDFGISKNLTLSNGQSYNVSVRESDRLKKLSRKINRKIKGSNNWNKTRKLLNVEYQKLSNKKNDLANKIIHDLLEYKNIYMQDENLKGWHKDRRYSKTVQHSIMGRIKSKLIINEQTIVLDMFTPTTKVCYNCGQVHDDLTLKDRIFKCDCGIEPEDRDIKAAKSMIIFSKRFLEQGSLEKFKKLPVGRREVTSVEINSSASNSKNFSMKQKSICSIEDATSLA